MKISLLFSGSLRVSIIRSYGRGAANKSQLRVKHWTHIRGSIFLREKSQLRIKSEPCLINVEMIYRSSISFFRQSKLACKKAPSCTRMYDPVFKFIIRHSHAARLSPQ